MRLLAATLALLPALAAAQAITLTLPADPTADSYRFSAAGCRSTLTLQWTYTSLGTPVCSALSLWSTSASSCADAPATGDVSYADVPYSTVVTQKQGTFEVKVAELPGFVGTNAGVCGSSGVTVTHHVCGAVTTSYDCNFGSKTTLKATSLALVYDTQPPTPPTIDSVTALDGAARVAFTPDADTVTVRLEAKGPSDADFTQRAEVAASAGTIRASGLVNGDTYELRLRGVDQAGNVSDPSDAVPATPILTQGFWGVLRNDGSTEQGGCQAAGGPLLLGLGAALWALSRRRAR